MKPVEQAVLRPPAGDCFAACVASILECQLQDVPNFVATPEETWWQQAQDWFSPLNLHPLFLEYSEEWWPRGYAIANVLLDSDVNHAVVVYDRTIVWDPHPGRAARVIRRTNGWTIFQVLDPARPSGWRR